MQPIKRYKLILKSRIYTIPQNFLSLHDVDSNISKNLKNIGFYKVKSNVRDEIFQSFINHWVHKEPPLINIDNISEFELLSQEFDIMKDVILLFQKTLTKFAISPLIHKNHILQMKIFEKKFKLQKNYDIYSEIIEILLKQNQIIHSPQFLDFKLYIHDACDKDDTEKVSLLTMKKIEKNGFVFYLNENDQTAILLQHLDDDFDYEEEGKKSILIPRSVIYDSREYIVTEIGSESLSYEDMNSVEFPEDSEVKTIAENAFFESDLESLTIPSSVVELKDSWCHTARNLINISISSENQNFSFYNDTFIIGKSDISSNVKDVLLFMRRDIETVKIPSFIKIISPYAFNSCYSLTSIEFEENSELKYIEEKAFLNCSLKSIVIPQHVVKIGEFSFCNCHIKKIEFAKNSELKFIDNSAFSSSHIESIVIPSNVIHIGVNAFSNCTKLKKVEFSDENKIHSFGEYIFQCSSVENISIPSTVFELEIGWCSMTYNLINIKISPNNHYFKYIDDKFLFGKSNLLTDDFDVLLFVRRDIQKVTVPSFIKQIGPFALCSCKNLNKLEFQENSEIQKFDKSAFSNSSIEKLTIPSNLTEIGRYSFCECQKLKIIEFNNDSKLIKIDSSAFLYSSLIEITIPSSVIQICSGAFNSCKQLKKVEFSKDSKLKIIEDGAFSSTELEQIIIPKHVTKICENTFYFCEKLKTIDFPDDSELKIIEKNAFLSSSLERIKIPSSLEFLNDEWCSGTKNLNEIVLMKENKNFSFLNNSIIIGKSDSKSDYYDTVYFAVRNIKKATIPSFIKKIAPRAFEECHNLKSIEFEEESKLKSIGQYSFKSSSLPNICIPQNVNIIGCYAFNQCNELKKVEFSPHSKLNIIDNAAFCASSINEITIPPKVKIICNSSFSDCTNLKKLQFSPKSELSIIEHNAFMASKITSISLPANLKYIGKYAFYNLLNLEIIEIEENSKLSSINTEQFICSHFKCLMIPAKLNGLIELNFNEKFLGL